MTGLITRTAMHLVSLLVNSSWNLAVSEKVGTIAESLDEDAENPRKDSETRDKARRLRRSKSSRNVALQGTVEATRNRGKGHLRGAIEISHDIPSSSVHGIPRTQPQFFSIDQSFADLRASSRETEVAEIRRALRKLFGGNHGRYRVHSEKA